MSKGSAESATLAAALGYADDGWCVLPMHFPPDGQGGYKKKPLTDWVHGDEGSRATISTEVIRRWWRKWPRAGIGIACEPSELLVIDVDGDVGETSLASLEDRLGVLPVTRTATTPRGRHLYFTAEEPPPNTVNKLGQGIDTRGSGGFVVAPPSTNRHTGKTYAWADQRVPLAQLPPAWVSALAPHVQQRAETPARRRISTAPGTYAARVLEDELDNVRSAESGERNNTLNTAAFNLGRFVGGGYLTEDEVRDALSGAAHASELGVGETNTTISSGLRAGRTQPLTLVVEASSPGGDEAKIQQAVERLRIQEAARDRVAAARAEAAFRVPESDWSLKEALTKDIPPLSYTIDRLHPKGSNSLITSQYKVGKTSLAQNLTKCYADGDKFLGDFAVEPGAGRIAYLNYELTEAMWLDGMRRLEVENPDRIAPLHLRGQRFDLRSPSAFKWLVSWLCDRDCDAMILDPYGAAAMLQDENNNSEARHWLRGLLDPLKEAAGITDLWMPAHTGRTPTSEGDEHARGASELDDWADVRWLYTKTTEPQQSENGLWFPRWLRAHGRQVDVPERRLAFDAEDGSLFVDAYESRSVNRRESGAVQALQVCQATPGLNSTELRAAMRGDTKVINQGVKEAVERGWIEVRPAQKGNARLHYPTEKGLRETVARV